MFAVLAVLVIFVIVGLLFLNAGRRLKLPIAAGDWGANSSDDPRIAAAAMLFSVAREEGEVDSEKSAQIVELLVATLGLAPDAARTCLGGGQRLARRLEGNLNSRLHQLRAPIERHCSAQEKQDVVDMLRSVAGRNLERTPSIREAVGRIAASLLHG